MWEDPIVKELHDQRKKLAESYGYDVKSIVKYYQEKQKNVGRQSISRACQPNTKSTDTRITR